MKYIILVGDGMADYPLPDFGDRTPLEIAKTPNMDYVACSGILGRVKTIPDGMLPGSDVAGMSLMGYAPEEYYTGRAPLEAANLGIELGECDVAFRCNFVTVVGDTLIDFSSGHITTEEGHSLVYSLNHELGTDDVVFYGGVGYRNLLIMRKASNNLVEIRCSPPHDIIGQSVAEHLPQGMGQEELIRLMQKSSAVLAHHEVNSARVQSGNNPGNMIWLWGQGTKPNLPTYRERYGLDSGVVISAVDLIKGLGKILGLKVIDVPGATGYYDTDYHGKAMAAVEALENVDFVLVHVEAPDEAGHNGDLKEKIRAIENFDRFVVGKVLEYVEQKQDARMMVLPDHFTPLSVRTHTREPVPFAICGHHVDGGGFLGYSEREAEKSEFVFGNGCQLIEYLFERKAQDLGVSQYSINE